MGRAYTMGTTKNTDLSVGRFGEAIEAVFISKVIPNLKNAAFIGIMIDESMFIDLAV